MDQHSAAEIVRQLLIDAGVIGDAMPDEWPSFINGEPDGDYVPDEVITIYDTEGELFARPMPGGKRLEYPGIQVRIRAEDHLAGHRKGREIATILDEQSTQLAIVVDDVDYFLNTVRRTSGVLSLGKDVPNGKRSIFTVNGIVSYRQIILDLTTGLSAYYPFEDSALDIWNGKHLTESSPLSYNDTGAIGKCATSSSGTKTAERADDLLTDNNTSSTYTVAGFFSGTVGLVGSSVVFLDSSAEIVLKIGIREHQEGGGLQAYLVFGRGGFFDFDLEYLFPNLLNPNNFIHLAVASDGSNVIPYLNGVPHDPVAFLGGGRDFGSASGVIRIEVPASTWIDELAVYGTRALDVDEIAQLISDGPNF